MKQVVIKDKTFGIAISSEQIQKRVGELGKQLEQDLKGKNPVFIPVLNGAVLFFADLLKHISVECEISFLRVSSYKGMQSTDAVKNIIGLNENITGRSVVIVEDIVDTGNTLKHLFADLKKKNPSEIKVVTLLHKPEAMRHNLKPDYVGFEVPAEFVVGYGLDYEGLGRNLKDIYKLV
jgi:hypoxanthine phosphoribosyltransferase